MIRQRVIDLPGLFDDSRLEVDLLEAVDEDERVLLEARAADEARLGRVGDFIWLRLRVGKSFTDLVFHAKSKPRGARNAVSSTTRALLSSAVAR